jgi:hypothetical protein
MARTYINQRGYRCFADSGKLVHLWVAKKKYGSIPKGAIVHHKDGNKLNNNPNNLILITKKEHANHHFTQARRHRELQKIMFGLKVAFILFIIFLIMRIIIS